MRDGEARFAADLARSVGRLDWWNIKAEHTPYEWVCQIAMYQVNPFGERRADIREAISATNQILASAGAKVSKQDAQALFESIRDYLKCNEQTDEEDVDFEALKKVKGSA